MRIVTGTENEFELDGVTYIAKQQQNCDGCAFKALDDCGSIRRPYCGSYSRKDDVSVIFIRKPATPESQPIMTSTKPTPVALSTPAPTTARPLDFSRPVQTRNGIPVRILCTNSGIIGQPVLGIADGEIAAWSLEGKHITVSESGIAGVFEFDLIQEPQPRKHAELIKKWAADDAMRIKFKTAPDEWLEALCPDFDPDWEYEEILPGDPLY